MDEGLLNDLLECSVCLERLDTSSKVLPCQHTFCRRCLEGIVERHKELRCPECRILVTCKIEELPPNVLLMRILEGMRNAAPKKQQQQQRLIRVVQHTTPVHQHHHHHHPTADPRHTPSKQVPQQLQPHQPYAKALYDYVSKEPGDLNFKRGDIIILRKRIDNNWYQGVCDGNQGVFPLSYVQMITPLPSNIPQCKALYDFRMTNDDEEGCLTFNKGDIFVVIRRVDENWAEGKLDDRIGIFPLAFVELNNLASSLMKLSTNVLVGPSRLAPPTPTSDDSAPLIPTDHSRTVANVHVTHCTAQPVLLHQPAPTPVQQSLPISDSSSAVSSGNSTSTTPNTSSGGTSSSSSTAPSSPASPPCRNQTVASPRTAPKPDLVPNTSTNSTPSRTQNVAATSFSSQSTEPHSSHQHNREKRHSFTSLNPSHHHTNTHRHSAEILSSDPDVQAPSTNTQSQSAEQPKRNASSNDINSTGLQLPAAYVALYPYKPQKADELELRKGGIYIVTERCQDGWFKGTSNRTQKCGVFPGNYVTLARGAPRSPQPSLRSGESSSESKLVVSYTRSGKLRQSANSLPPDLPPRSSSPATATNTISSSWHGQQDNAAVPLGRSSSAIMSSVANSPHLPTNCATIGKSVDKQKERKEKGTVSLMRRLTSIKRSKSPPASSYSMDNPVFEDSSVPVTSSHPVHVRSGSCPSQLLQALPVEHHRMFVSTSQRLKHKDRPSVFVHNSRSGENHVAAGSSGSSPDVHHHRKSNSLDAGNRTKTGTQTVRERFRCIAPYPPNSEYELELQVNDIIYVHKKRDDGWYKGTQQRTGRTGLFPASFVESF